MKKLFLAAVVVVAAVFVGCVPASDYKGVAFSDEQYKGGSQHIPGKVYMAYYDAGGEGVAYHDATAKNHGSGELNPLDGSYLHGFRAGEGVDTSYTKSANETDNSAFNTVAPPMELLYVGWTEPGEWTNYSVVVDKAGTYTVELLYTSNRGGKVSLDVDGVSVLTDIDVASTFHPDEPVGWRQWHHWNVASLGRVELKKGAHVLTFRTTAVGQMNYAWLEFR